MTPVRPEYGFYERHGYSADYDTGSNARWGKIDRVRLHERIVDRSAAVYQRTLVRAALGGAVQDLDKPVQLATWKPYCDDPVPMALGVAGQFNPLKSPRSGRQLQFFVPCRKCEKCSFVKQSRWRERAMHEVTTAHRTWFVTLTFAPYHLAKVLTDAKVSHGNKQAFERAGYSQVQLFLKRLRKQIRGKLRYIAIPEWGEKRGRLHYHLLLSEVDKPILKRILERAWPSFVHARLVKKADRMVRYVTKYITKETTGARVRASRYYGKPRPSGPKEKNSTPAKERNLPRLQTSLHGTSVCKRGSDNGRRCAKPGWPGISQGQMAAIIRFCEPDREGFWPRFNAVRLQWGKKRPFTLPP